MAKQSSARARKNRFSSLLNRRRGELKGSGASFSRLLRIESLESREMLSANGFSQNDLVVERFGDGSASLTSASTAVFLDEFTTSGGSAVNTVALPTAAGGGN